MTFFWVGHFKFYSFKKKFFFASSLWKLVTNYVLEWMGLNFCDYDGIHYSIVKDSSANLGVNSKIVQIRPTIKAVSTKISKKNFLHICQYFDISERK